MDEECRSVGGAHPCAYPLESASGACCQSCNETERGWRSDQRRAIISLDSQIHGLKLSSYPPKGKVQYLCPERFEPWFDS